MKIDCLNSARKRKDDQFYTRQEDVEKELNRYDFQGLKVYCPCDSRESAFTKYFEGNFHALGLKELAINWKNKDGTGTIARFDGEKWSDTNLLFGGFEMPESTEVLKEADIVVTNPPFSLACLFFKWLGTDKQFIVIGPLTWFANKYLYANYIFGQRKLWEGFEKVNTFGRPDGSFKKLNTLWFQTIKRNFNKHLELQEMEVGESDFMHYSHPSISDIIYIKKCKDIPKNYMGRIAVPISFLLADNCEDYEIYPSLLNQGQMVPSSESKLADGSPYFTRVCAKKKFTHKDVG